jgi:hypothetical protein
MSSSRRWYAGERCQLSNRAGKRPGRLWLEHLESDLGGTAQFSALVGNADLKVNEILRF